MEEYEQELQLSMRNRELVKLLNLEKSLVYFNTSLKANDMVMVRLGSGRFISIDEDDEDILEDAQIENQQAIEMAKIYSDILAGMMDAYASVISNNLNIVMKFLTAVTIVLMLPNLVASIYGMNINLPFQHNPHAFVITMGFSFLISLVVVYIFIKKKMF
jgi:magnesium transporter